MSKGGMQSCAIHHNYCPICQDEVFVQINFVEYEPYEYTTVYKHALRSGNIKYCDKLGNKRVRKLPYEVV